MSECITMLHPTREKLRHQKKKSCKSIRRSQGHTQSTATFPKKLGFGVRGSELHRTCRASTGKCSISCSSFLVFQTINSTTSGCFPAHYTPPPKVQCPTPLPASQPAPIPPALDAGSCVNHYQRSRLRDWFAAIHQHHLHENCQAANRKRGDVKQSCLKVFSTLYKLLW